MTSSVISEVDSAFHSSYTNAVHDRPPTVASLQAVDVATACQSQVIRRLPVGPDEEVIGLGMGFVTVHLGRVVEHVVLVPGLCRVVGECPLDEVVDLADESHVVVYRAVVICGAQQSAIAAVHPSRIPHHAVTDLREIFEARKPSTQVAVYRHSLSQPLMPMTSAMSRRGAGPNTCPLFSRATGSRQPCTAESGIFSRLRTSFS